MRKMVKVVCAVFDKDEQSRNVQEIELRTDPFREDLVQLVVGHTRLTVSRLEIINAIKGV